MTSRDKTKDYYKAPFRYFTDALGKYKKPIDGDVIRNKDSVYITTNDGTVFMELGLGDAEFLISRLQEALED